jgi:signal transduction histidine kinase/ligand-binding sensor domain-containing protein
MALAVTAGQSECDVPPLFEGVPGVPRMTARRSSRSFLIAAWIVFLSAPMFALDPHQPLVQLYHTSWNAKNGLDGSVLALAQTTDGYLWVGTTAGLFRFDGISFEPYKPDSGSFPSNTLTALMAVPDGGLWIGYNTGGASLLKAGRLTNYTDRDGFPLRRVRCFARDQDGAIWAGVTGGFTRLEGQRWQTVRLDWNYPAKSASALFVDTNGTLWVGSGSGILFLPKGEKKFHDTGIHTGRVVAIAEAPDGTLFFSQYLKPGVQAFRSPADRRSGRLPIINLSAAKMLFDRDGALWIAGNGVSRVPPQNQAAGWQTLAYLSSAETLGLADSAAQTVLEDREGNIWVGTDGGLDRFRHRNLSWFALPEGTHEFSLVAGDHGDVWAGSWGEKTRAVIRVQDGKLAAGGPKAVLLAYRDPDGAIWFDGPDSFMKWTGAGFSKIPPPDQVRRLQLSSATKDPVVISSMTKDRKGTYWISYNGTGEFEWKDGVWHFTPILKDHPDWSSNQAFTDAADRIWLSYPERVAVVDRGKVRTFSSQEGLEIGPFNIVGGGDQQIWVGGEGGLAFLKESRFHTLKGANGNGFRGVDGIVVVPNDGLWLSASAGIVHVPEPEVQRAIRQRDYPVNYEVLDLVSDLPEQLQSVDTSYSSGVIQAGDGTLWFATRSGAARIDPTHIFRNPVPPPVVIRSLIADDKTYSTFENETLPALTKNLEIDYTALSLSIPERVRFRYMLEGSDKDWHDAGTRRQAFYTNPKPGPYRFRVLACNNDGVWNETGATLAFIIAPAFYQTTWFQALYWAAAAGIVLASIRWWMRLMGDRLAAQFQERLAERTRIAQDLHDTLLQGFISASLQLNLANRKLTADSDAKPLVTEVLELMKKVIDEGRSAVQGMRLTLTDSSDLEKSFSRIRGEAVADEPANFRVLVEGPARALHALVRDDVYRIGREAIINAFRHSGATNVEVELRYSDRDLRLFVRDDGRGIEPQILRHGRKGHWGLSGMRETAERIRAKLRLQSRLSEGTEVELIVPAEIAFAAPMPRPPARRWWRIFRPGGRSNEQSENSS